MIEAYIKIKNIQHFEDDKDITELTTVGRYDASDGTFVISYDDTETTGFEGSTTVLTVKPGGIVTMERRGTSNSNLIIENGKKHYCSYGTPYGDMMLGIDTKAVVSTLDYEGGGLYFKYIIDMNSAFMSENEIFITVEGQNETEFN